MSFYVGSSEGETLLTADRNGPVDVVTFHVWLSYYSDVDALSTWDSALWDAAAPPGWTGDPPRTDLACNTMSVSIQTGRDEPLSRFRPGTCSVVIDDPEGLFTPWRVSSEQYNTIRPGIKLEVYADYLSTSYPLFTGFVTSIVDTFPNTTRHVVAFNATDALQFLAGYDGQEHIPAVGAGELSGYRVVRILAELGLIGPIVPPSINPGTVTLQATSLAQNYLNEIGLVTDTELGAFYVSRAGVFQYYDRNTLATNPAFTTIAYTFGEVPPELCYQELTLANDSSQVRNVVTIANAGGTAVTHTDANSIANHGMQTWQRLDLIHDDPAQSPTIADAYLAVFATSARRVESLTINPVANPEVIPAALNLGLLRLIRVIRRASGFDVAADLQIEAVNHEISATDWTVTYKTFSAKSIFQAGRWVGAGSTFGSKWETALWGH